MEFVAQVFDRRGKVAVEGIGSPLETLEDACRRAGGTPRRKRPVRHRGSRRGRDRWRSTYNQRKRFRVAGCRKFGEGRPPPRWRPGQRPETPRNLSNAGPGIRPPGPEHCQESM
jgi:hypothetical protein